MNHIRKASTKTYCGIEVLIDWGDHNGGKAGDAVILTVDPSKMEWTYMHTVYECPDCVSCILMRMVDDY